VFYFFELAYGQRAGGVLNKGQVYTGNYDVAGPGIGT